MTVSPCCRPPAPVVAMVTAHDNDKRALVGMLAVVVLPLDAWKQNSEVPQTGSLVVGTRAEILSAPHNFRLVLDEKRRAKQQKAQDDKFYDAACFPGLFRKCFHDGCSPLLINQRPVSRTPNHRRR